MDATSCASLRFSALSVRRQQEALHPHTCPEMICSIFRNVVSSELVLHPFTSAKQLVQECRWQFLLFQGTFRRWVLALNSCWTRNRYCKQPVFFEHVPHLCSVFEVAEDPAARSLAFNANSAFMRHFVGQWEVLPQPGGGAAVRHHLCVEPSMRPPQRVGDLSKQIFVGQVQSILEDLAQGRLGSGRQGGDEPFC